ncbi:MAG: helix-turn-helix domain-containing protein [Chthoniobacterales bacterium]|jgi:transcriptional regulator with XRE-family HTH domain
MPPEELDRLMAELRTWCKANHGEQKKLAEALGISEQLLSNWIARRKTPGLQKYLALHALLNERRRGSGQEY